MEAEFPWVVQRYAKRNPHALAEICYLIDAVPAPVIFQSYSAIRYCENLLPCREYTVDEITQIAVPIVRSYLYWKQYVNITEVPNCGCGVIPKTNV